MAISAKTTTGRRPKYLAFRRKLSKEIAEVRMLTAQGVRLGSLSWYPAIDATLEAAVKHARQNENRGHVCAFHFRGRNFLYTVTSFGRLILRDSKREVIASSGLGAIDE